MQNELQIRIAKDLNIIKFNSESENEYNQRIVYSAVSLWVRTLIYGNSINDMRQDSVIGYENNTLLTHIIRIQLRCYLMLMK